MLVLQSWVSVIIIRRALPRRLFIVHVRVLSIVGPRCLRAIHLVQVGADELQDKSKDVVTIKLKGKLERKHAYLFTEVKNSLSHHPTKAAWWLKLLICCGKGVCIVTPPLPSFPSFQARWQLMHDVIQSTSAVPAPKRASARSIQWTMQPQLCSLTKTRPS
jgi:hypothetical protein